MTNWLAQFGNFAFAAAALLAAAAVVLSVMWAVVYTRERKARHQAKEREARDLVHMRILFQTMRDIVEQQKGLARDLNRSLDKKVAFIKQTVDGALQDVEALRGAVQQISEILHAVGEEVAALKSRVALAGEAPAGETPAAVATESPAPLAGALPPGFGEDDASEPEADAPALPSRREPVSLRILTRPAEKLPSGDDVIDTWAAIDGGEDEGLDTSLFEGPAEPPEEPEDAEAAREAFRALLNLAPAPVLTAAAPATATKTEAAPATAREHHGGNGHGDPLKRRVYEYSDAGMSVAQISRELGMGKGEIRLILNLRKGREQ